MFIQETAANYLVSQWGPPPPSLARDFWEANPFSAIQGISCNFYIRFIRVFIKFWYLRYTEAYKTTAKQTIRFSARIKCNSILLSIIVSLSIGPVLLHLPTQIFICFSRLYVLHALTSHSLVPRTHMAWQGLLLKHRKSLCSNMDQINV